MYIVSVTVRVKGEAAGDFIEATLENACRTRGESGNVRFDVARCVDDPARFLLYEVYASQDDFAAHQQTDHYLRWRETVADWMAQPREGVKHSAIFFGDGPVE
jgi:autoinducer 2-degrading protein